MQVTLPSWSIVDSPASGDMLPLVSPLWKVSHVGAVCFFVKSRVPSQDYIIFLTKCLSEVAILNGAGHSFLGGNVDVQGKNLF